MNTWSWRLATPPRTGSVAIVELWGDVEAAFAALDLPAVGTGTLALRAIRDIDSALVSRPSHTFAQVMPHGGPAVLHAITERLLAHYTPSTHAPRPEAASAIEAAMLEALARAASPAAIDLLLLQPARWAAHFPALDPASLPPGDPDTDDLTLDRLLSPPLVVAWGTANIGKSSLCNALAGREAAIVADQPGTTRDHVGVLLDLDGLTVRYLDTPGVRDTHDPLEREAASQAAHLAARADLLLLCGDPLTPPPPPPPTAAHAAPATLAILLRSDLAPPTWTPDIITSAKLGSGLADLARAIRETLLPSRLSQSDRPWRFWHV